MISVFFSHVCGNGTSKNCLLSNRLLEKLKKDFPSVYPYLSCQDTTWTNSTDLNDKVKSCHFFIPVICDSFVSSGNCKGELAIARKQKQEAGAFPFIFPAKYGCSDEVMKELGFPIDQTQETGERWESFVDSDFEFGYENLRQRVHHKALEHNLITNEDFHKDIKVFDLLLKENNPTAFYVKTAIDACRKGEEYGFYFFKRLTHEGWLFHLFAGGFFNNNPAPVEVEAESQKGMFTIPFWPVLFYLEKISVSSNRNIHVQIIEIIRRVSNPPEPNKRQDNYRTWYIFSKVMANLPTDAIKLEDIDLIEYWLDSKFDNGLVGREIARNLLPKLLSSGVDDIKKAIRMVEIITQPKKPNQVLMAVDELEKLFQKNATDLGRQCGREIIPILQSRLESELVISEKDDNYSYIWRSAVENHEKNTSRHEPKHALISGLRDVLVAYAQAQDATDILKKLWQSPRLTVRRIVLFALNQGFDRYSDLCQKLITDNMPDIFLESNYHHELYGIIAGHFSKFSKETQDVVIKVLDDLQRQWPKNVSQEEQAELNMHTRQRWFYAIKQSGYSLSKELETKYVLNKYQPEHPDFLSYHGPVTWGAEQLFGVGDLMAKGSVKNIVDFLNDFEGKNRFNEIGYEEAGEVLKQAIKTNQQFFETDIEEFLRSIPDYQYYLLRSFEEIWNDKKPVNWEGILGFAWKLLNKDDFWTREAPEPKRIGIRVGKDWIPSAIANLIQKGVKVDEWVMPDGLLSEVRKILELLLEKVEPSAKGKDSDALTEAINSPKGHAIETYINYALRQCRIYT